MNRILFLFILFNLSTLRISAQKFELISDYNITTEGYTGSYVADINQDGYDDILYADKREILAFINKANGKYEFEKILLHKDQSPIKTFELWDMDHDSDLDILVGITGRIIQIENKSTLVKPEFIKVSKDFYFQGVQYSAVPVFDFDYINNDTLYDVVTSYGKTKILYQKPDSTFFDYEIPNSTYSDFYKIKVADLDNDTKNDLVFGRKGKPNEPGLFYILNLNNTFSVQNTLLKGEIKDFIITDIDSNSKKDIIAITEGENKNLSLLRNTGLIDSLYAIDSFNLSGLNTYSSFAMKIDENNRLKILAGADQKSTLVLYDIQIDNGKINWEKTDLNTPEFITKQLFFTDLDKDGDDDIVQILDDNGFNIYQQINPSNVANISLTTKIYPNPTNNILNISANQIISGIKIKDIFGQTIYTKTGINASIVTLDLDAVNAGYFIIETESSHHSSQFNRLIVVK
ncbi:MAG: VCBS repeat-containing protein [Saprospiraceae bacterium]|nr:VCBS repeat-containing protein [Saprospiraceae bacterium]